MDENKDNVQEISVKVEQQNAQNFFLKLVETIKKYGIIRTTCAVGLFALVMSVILHPLDINQLIKEALLDIENIKAEQHEEGIMNREKQNELIPIILDNIRGGNRQDRVMLMELHNGGISITGLPFLRFTQTFESINGRKDVDYISDQYNQQTIGNYPFLFSELGKKGYLFRGEISDRDTEHKIFRRQKNNGISCLYITQLYGRNGKMIGFLNVSSQEVDQFELEDVMGKTGIQKRQLEDLLEK